MTRFDMKALAALLGVVLILAIGIGYGVGRFAAPAPSGAIPWDGGETPPAFNAMPEAGLPWYEDLYVNDDAGLLAPETEAEIRDELATLRRQTGIEMTLLTIPSMADYGRDGPIEPFATAVFNAWGIGDATRNDGVLILVAREDREMRIELGSGYDASWDTKTQAVIDDAFLPAFRKDRYDDGIREGVRAAIVTFGGYVPGTEDQGPIGRGWALIGHWLASLGAVAVAVIAAPLAGLGFGTRRYLRLRPRSCPACGAPMQRLDEIADDAYLDPGQQTEERIGSVNYDVWACTQCSQVTITEHTGLGVGKARCPACHYRTLTSVSKVLTPATRSSTGRKEITQRCQNCPHEHTETRVIPRLRNNDNDDGFGGGRSSGGGASGKW